MQIMLARYANEECKKLFADISKNLENRDQISKKTERLLLALDADYPIANASRAEKRFEILDIQWRKKEENEAELEKNMHALDMFQHATPVTNEQIYIYVLECEMGKYYVGRTKNVARQFIEHKLGYGAAWTALNPPIGLIECIPSSDIALNPEDAELFQIKEYMLKYGIENVRGATYSQVILSEAQTQQLRRAVNLRS